MEIPIVDMKGKDLGKMVLNDEVHEILEKTGISLMVEYNTSKEQVVGHLHITEE